METKDKPIDCNTANNENARFDQSSIVKHIQEDKPVSEGEKEDNFYKWILTEIVEFERLKEDQSLSISARTYYDLASLQMKKVRQMYNDRKILNLRTKT